MRVSSQHLCNKGQEVQSYPPWPPPPVRYLGFDTHECRLLCGKGQKVRRPSRTRLYPRLLGGWGFDAHDEEIYKGPLGYTPGPLPRLLLEVLGFDAFERRWISGNKAKRYTGTRLGLQYLLLGGIGGSTHTRVDCHGQGTEIRPRRIRLGLSPSRRV